MTGHQINSLVGDLVAMAQAMERLPQVETELHRLEHELEQAHATISHRELRIIDLKQQIEDLQSKLSQAEVARDDAELRFLEADEKSSKVVRFLAQIQGMAVQAECELNPPKPMPQPEVTAEAVYHVGDRRLSDNGSVVSVQTDPTNGASVSEEPSQSDPTGVVPDTVAVEHSGTSPLIVDAPSAVETNPGPYHGRRYIDVPGWISRADWLAGGGTNEDYDWREGQQSAAQ
jgi:hypothetical protein